MKPIKGKKISWEEEWKKELLKMAMNGKWRFNIASLEDFISTLLSEQKKELRKEIEKIVNKKFPIGEREWCVDCGKRIYKDILNLPILL